MGAIEPTKDQLEAFMAADQDEPIVMLNLLKFRAKADYPEGQAGGDVSGQEAYARYAAIAQQKITDVGGRALWMAPKNMMMIGDEADADWDVAAAIFYPSRAAFFKMMAMPDYQAGLVHRTAGLDHQLLVQCPASGIGA